MKWTDVTPNTLNNENPWDNNNPWGKPKKPNRPNGGGQNNEELDELIRKSQQVLQGLFNNKSGKGKGDNGTGGGNGTSGGPAPAKLFGLIAGFIFVIWALSGFYIIEEGSRGLVLRFGEYQRTTSPGPNYHLPFPIEKVEKVQVERIRTEEVGYSSFGRGGRERAILEESLMLTGDENIVDVRMDVQWVIKDARDFIFNVRNPDTTIKSAAESAIRDVMGKTAYNTAIAGEGRATIAEETQNLLQSILDNYKMGVQINSIQMRPIDPPAQVIDAFRDVQSARADKEKEINQAEAYRNDILPRAKGDAEKILQQAEAYKQEVIARAEGESDRFISIYDKYKTAKTVTKQRMYLEAMEDILNGMEKVVIDSDAQGSGVLPYLPLSTLQNKSAR